MFGDSVNKAQLGAHQYKPFRVIDEGNIQSNTQCGSKGNLLSNLDKLSSDLL